MHIIIEPYLGSVLIAQTESYSSIIRIFVQLQYYSAFNLFIIYLFGRPDGTFVPIKRFHIKVVDKKISGAD